MRLEAALAIASRINEECSELNIDIGEVYIVIHPRMFENLLSECIKHGVLEHTTERNYELKLFNVSFSAFITPGVFGQQFIAAVPEQGPVADYNAQACIDPVVTTQRFERVQGDVARSNLNQANRQHRGIEPLVSGQGVGGEPTDRLSGGRSLQQRDRDRSGGPR